MAIPTDYIFTPGTCLKKDFYGVLKNALLSAGWINITSNYATDGDVLTSPGNTGDKALIINMRSANVKNDYDTATTAYCLMSIRFPTSYTPGAAGVAGTFVRPGGWQWMAIYPATNPANVQLAMDTIYNYKLYVDKSKLIFSIEFPLGLNTNPIFHYIGLPDSIYCDEAGNRGMVWGTTCYSQSATGNVLIADRPNGISSASDVYDIPLLCNLSAKNPNNSGKFGISDIYYGNSNDGVRGKLDGIFTFPSTGLLTGDTITIGSNVYYALICHQYYNNSFPSLGIAIRIQ